MPSTATRLAVPAVLAALAAGLAIAQPGTPQRPQRPAQPGLQPGGQPGGPQGDPNVFIDRLMSFDADGDGRLSRSEVPERFAENTFTRFDANADGFIDRAELEAARGAAGGPGRAPGVGGGGGRSMEAAMHQVEEAIVALSGSALNASTLGRDLEQCQRLQENLLACKAATARQRMNREAIEDFDGDEAQARSEFRALFVEALMEALMLESALLDEDAETAREHIEALEELEDLGHTQFRID